VGRCIQHYISVLFYGYEFNSSATSTHHSSFSPPSTTQTQPRTHPPTHYRREYPEVEDGKLSSFKLALHCGGCMIDAQKMRARLMDMQVGRCAALRCAALALVLVVCCGFGFARERCVEERGL